MNWSDTQARRAFAHDTAGLAILATGSLTPIESLVATAIATESPIEALFSTWFLAARDHLVAAGMHRFALTLRAQPWVGPYRLDFSLQPQDAATAARLEAASLELRAGVELDGHPFHERTRDQVTRRNRRDRQLLDMGWRVLHFSGSELHPNPMFAVVEALEHGAFALDQTLAALRHQGGQ